ncbi:MAG: hypothetical protein HOP07_05290 [Bacteriovoracaceae bacterium]|nr:hypothetical protein [Bacteriovoracaceae bacterium]
MKILIERFKKSIPYVLVILFISWAMYKYFLERNIKPKTSLALDWESLEKSEKSEKSEKLPIEKKELIPVKEKEFTTMSPAEKDAFNEYDIIEKKWLEIVKNNLGESFYFQYLEMREQNDKEKMSAYQEYHDYLRQKQGDKFEYNISEDQSERERKINQIYLNKLLEIIGPAKFQEYLKSRDQFNEESRRNNKEFILMEF